MTNKKTAVGVAGAGYIANFAHLPPLAKIRGVNLAAVCDRDITAARAAAEKFGIPNVYTSLDEMLSAEKLDMVDVCLPPQEHKDALVTILKRGINCLVEKPLTVNTADADAVIALADEQGVKLHVTYNFSVVPAVIKAKKLIASGAIGDVVGVHINNFVLPHERYFAPDHWCHDLPGEYFADLAPHLAMLMTEFIGPADSVQAAAEKLDANTPLRFDELRIIGQNAGAMGTITCSLNCPAFLLTMDIAGTRGMIHLSGDYQAVVCYRATGHYSSAWSRGMVGVKDILSRLSALAETSANVLIGKYAPLTMGHRHLIESSIRSLRGEGDYPLDIRHAREAVRLLETAFRQIEG